MKAYGLCYRFATFTRNEAWKKPAGVKRLGSHCSVFDERPPRRLSVACVTSVDKDTPRTEAGPATSLSIQRFYI